MITTWIDHPLWAQLGLTLAHFLWQGAAIAIVLAAVLWLLRRRSANARYVSCGAAMLLMAACPVATLWYVHAHPLPALRLADQALLIAGDARVAPGHDTALPTSSPEPDGIVRVMDAGELLPAGTETPDHSDDTASQVRRLATPPIEPIAAAPITTPPQQRWLILGFALAAMLWCCGVVALGLRLMVGWITLHRLGRRETEPLPEAIEARVGQLCERFGLRQGIRAVASRAAGEPLAFGLLRPIVLMPISMLSQCPIELVEAIVAHELAHIRRYDLWVNLLQRVIETVLFYHPAVWWVSGRMRLERELCCDDLAVCATGRRAAYAEALVTLSHATPGANAAALSAGVFGARVTLLTRVRRVLQLSPGLQGGRYWMAGPLSLLLAGSLLFVARIHASDPQASAAGAEETSPAIAATADEAGPETEATPAPQKPGGVLPQTAIVDTGSNETGSYEKEVDRQRAMLMPALEAIQTFYAFRDAVYAEDTAKLLELLRPGGKMLTEIHVKQLLTDCRSLKLDPVESWVVDRVTMVQRSVKPPGPPSTQWALVTCREFEREYDGSAWKVFTSCQMVGRWNVAPPFVTRLSVTPTADAGRIVDQFAERALKELGGDEAVMVREFEFNHGRPRSFETYRLTRPNAGTEGEAGALKWEPIEEESGTFLDPLRTLQCFETQPFSGFGGGRAYVAGAPTSAPATKVIAVRAMTDGLVGRVTVKPGQTVKKGNELLVFEEQQDIAIELEAAQVRLKAADRKYQLLSLMTEKGRVSVSATEIEDAKTELELARLEVERCQLRYKRAQVTSPVDGTVRSLFTERGSKVEAGDVIAQIEEAPSGGKEAEE
jgi:beta-lactamase regulating signal transducer with metallopeptidase domain/biotin carboxyl carrier protein